MIKSLSVMIVSSISALALAQPPLPNPPVPAGNPITESKRVLGKVLFWEEALSSSGSMSCGTCHAPSAGGGDPRRARSAGPDALLLTDDDIFGSPGVVASDVNNNFRSAPGFMFASQVTGRNSPTAYMAAYSTLNFWDGRAGPSFVNPQTGQVVLATGGALEAQSVGPPLSAVEMAHDGRTWTQLVDKLVASEPLAMVDAVPADVALALADNPSYPTLFSRAFGTPDVTAERIALALATYERTLVPNQTPWDRFRAGDSSALTAQQQLGMAVFNSTAGNCSICHVGNRFTNNAFHNIGVRPVAEDTGRQGVTGNPADRGKFKTPTIRNVGLRNSFFHNGQATTLQEVMDFYLQINGAPEQFADNLDPAAIGLSMTPAQVAAVIDFMANGLTDPRVAAATFPFDAPRLWSQRTELAPISVGGGTPLPGSGRTPLAVTPDPALIGEEVRLGVGNADAGLIAVVRVSTAAPVGGVLSGGEALPSLVINAGGAATARLYVTPGKYAPGVPLFVQWELSDPQSGLLLARSDVARVVPFCPRSGCPTPCVADFGSQGGFPLPDGTLDNNDFVAYIDAFFSQQPAADLGITGGVPGSDGQYDNNDLIVFIDAFFQGC